MIEMSFRQSLSMSSGSYQVFINRPIALAMLAVGLALLLLSAGAFLVKKTDWRGKLGLAPGQEKGL
jgi:TctA family transporter